MNAAAGWLSETVRWGQVNYNESDPRDVDLKAWAAYWRACKIQGVTVNAGGPVAFYPTEVPYQRRSSFLADGQDLFGDTVELARSMGLRVLARLDPSFANADLHHAHPDWCVQGPDGTARSESTVRPNPADPDEQIVENSYVTCHNGPAYSEYLPMIIREVMTNYPIDGFFTNGWPRLGFRAPSIEWGACFCPNCRALWDAVSPGDPLPQVANAADPIWWRYIDWVQTRVEIVQTSMRDLIASMNPAATLIAASFPALGTGLRWDRWVNLIDALGADGQGRRNHFQSGPASPAIWEAGMMSEITQAVAEGKPVIRFVGTYITDVYRHAARPALETRLLMAEALTHGDRPKWHTLGGSQSDRRWMPAVAEFDRWLADIDEVIHNRESAAEIGMIWSPRSVHLDEWSSTPRASHSDALHGWHAALLRARIPFDLVHEAHLDRLERYKVMILPSGLALSDAGIADLVRFRKSGGALIAVSDALLVDEFGVRRERDAYERLFGAAPDGGLIGPLSHSYVSLLGEDLFFDVGDTDNIAGGAWLQRLRSSTAQTAAPWIPDYPLHPTHATYQPKPDRDAPVVVRSADGSAIVLAMDLDAQYNRLGVPDHASVLGEAVKALLGVPAFEVEGEGLVDVKLWRGRDSYSAFMVNLDNPGVQGKFAVDTRPVTHLSVRIATPTQSIVESVRLLRHGAEAVWRRQGDHIVVSVPQIDDLEVVHVRLAAAD